jgi:V/A-type H+-transporting ATPase subunit E
MSHSALINNLRTRGRKEIAAIRQEARAEIDRLQAETGQRLAEEENGYRLMASQGRETVRRRLAVTARRQAAARATQAEQELDRRLYARARALLAELLNEDRAGIFTALAAEVPPGEWRTIAVHPEDRAAARRIFPGAAIMTDNEIIGGLVATGNEGRMTVINTLEKRLERFWPLLAPEVFREVVEDEPAD